MNKLSFTILINAPAQSVYASMLGLNNKSTYEYWTAAFNPTSTFEGNWDAGSKIYFVGCDENGKKSGMISQIELHEPLKVVSIRHYGFLDGDQEITTGEMVESWAGGSETYFFAETLTGTMVTVELDAVDAHKDYFLETYPKALQRLKDLLEK